MYILSTTVRLYVLLMIIFKAIDYYYSYKLLDSIKEIEAINGTKMLVFYHPVKAIQTRWVILDIQPLVGQ